MIMTPLLFIQNLPITSSDTEDVTSILTWIIGVLLIVSGFVIRNLLIQNSDRIRDLKEQLKDVEIKVEKEIAYNKEQGVANIKMITDIQHVLKDNSLIFTDNNGILKGNDTLLKENSVRIKDIHEKIK
jgi:hypothetical protein